MSKSRPVTFFHSLLIFSAFIVFSVGLFLIPFNILRRTTLKSSNEQNMLLIQQTSRNISELFHLYHTILLPLKENPDVVNFNPQGQRAFQNFLTVYPDSFTALTRIDKRGIILYTYPASRILGQDVSFRPHHKLAMSNQKPAVSDVITTLRGYRSVAYSIPLQDARGRSTGLLNALIPYDLVSDVYLNLLNGKYGHFWLLSGDGSVLNSTHKEHLGENIFSLHSNDTSLLSLARRMTNGQQGTHRLYLKENGKGKFYQAVFYPITIPQNRWVLCLAIPEDQILGRVHRFGLWWLLLFILFDSLLLFLVIRWVRRYTLALEEKRHLETEHRLRETESLLSRFINNAPIPILMARRSGIIEYINAHFQENYGYDTQSLDHVQKLCRLALPAQGSAPDIWELWKNELPSILETLVSYRLPERVLTGKNGEPHDVVLSFTGIEDRIVLSIEDRTVQNELAQREQELLARQSRSRKMEEIGLMAGGVAHDLNNILSGLVSYPDLLLYQLPPDSPLRPFIVTIQQSGIRAAQVVSDLLTVARGVSSQREYFRLGQVVEEYLQSPECQTLCEEHQEVNLKKTLTEAEDTQVYASRVHIRKSLMNLVHNAAEAIAGSGTVCIRCFNEELDSEAAQPHKLPPGKYSVLEVEDSGSGISLEDQQHIFEPFYTRKKMGKSGSGLGLSIVWNTAQDHNGSVSVRSDNGGTVFRLYIPAVNSRTEDQTPTRDLSLLQGRGETILVVDDEEIQSRIAADILNRFHYQVQRVDSGEAALEYLRSHSADLVLLDMVMGSGMNGRETFAALLKIAPKQKALIISGYAQSSEVDEALRLGVLGYIPKPYTIDQLVQSVRQALDS